MKIIHIEKEKRVKKTEEELKKELARCKDEMARMLVSEYKSVPTNKPTFIVKMSMEELQLVSFYLELEKRKPIMKPNIKVVLKKER